MMKGEKVLSFSFKKSNQAVTLAAKTKTKSDSDFPTTDIAPRFVNVDIRLCYNACFNIS
jgi:hypothetical protein